MKASIAKAIFNLQERDAIDILFLMAEEHPQTFECLLSGYSQITVPPSPPGLLLSPDPGATLRFSSKQWSELETFGKDDRISCIKRIRGMVGATFWQAKWIAEEKLGHKLVD